MQGNESHCFMAMKGVLTVLNLAFSKALVCSSSAFGNPYTWWYVWCSHSHMGTRLCRPSLDWGRDCCCPALAVCPCRPWPRCLSTGLRGLNVQPGCRSVCQRITRFFCFSTSPNYPGINNLWVGWGWECVQRACVCVLQGLSTC